MPLAELDAAEPLLLGIDADGPVFAVDEDPLREGRVPMVGSGGVRGEPPEGSGRERLSLRQAAAVLSPSRGGLVAYAAALLNWHRRHRFCSACGAESDIAEAGLTRVCPNCGAEHHPRTDPVVIMLVDRRRRPAAARPPGGWPARALLRVGGVRRAGRGARGGRRPRGARGVGRRGRLRYVASQPWPFPASLMLGFTAPYASGEPRVLDNELQDVRWFERAELEAASRAEDNEDWGTPGDPGGPLGSRRAWRSHVV